MFNSTHRSLCMTALLTAVCKQESFRSQVFDLPLFEGLTSVSQYYAQGRKHSTNFVA